MIPYKLRAVLLDLDGTLANTEDYYKPATVAVYEFLKPILKIVTQEQFLKAYEQARELTHSNLKGTASSHSRALYIQYALEILGAKYNSKIIYQARHVYWDYVMERAVLYPHVIEFLEKIQKNGIQTVLVTDNILDIQLLKLSRLKIDKYIDAVVTSEEAGADKPGINQFIFAMHKVNSTIYNTLVVGNNPKTDILGAQNANLPACLFDANNLYPEFADKVSCYANSYKTIIKHLGLDTINTNPNKLLIVDLMGVLFWPGHLTRDLLYPLLKKHGIALSHKQVRKQYLQLSMGTIDLPSFWKNLGVPDYKTLEKEFLNAWKLNTDLYKLLNVLAKHPNIHIVLTSNVPHTWGEYIVAKYNLKNIFEHIFFNDYIHIRKPDWSAYQRILSRYPNIKGANIYYIDDKLSSLRTARLLDIKTIWVKSQNPEDITHIPDYIAHTTSDLAKILQEIIKP